MKHSKFVVHQRTHALPLLRFDDSALTSFAGLVVLQALLSRLQLKERLRACMSHLAARAIFGHHPLCGSRDVVKLLSVMRS